MDNISNKNEQNPSIDDLTHRIKQLERELRVSKNTAEKLTKQLRAKVSYDTALAAQYRRQEIYTNVLMRYSPSCIFVLDNQGRYLMVSDSVAACYGVPSAGFFIGKSFEEIMGTYCKFTEADMAFMTEGFKALVGGTPTIRYYRNLDFGGGERYYLIECRRIAATEYSDDTILVIMTDNTELEMKKNQADSANKAKSHFLAAMSHEIRTPLNAVIGLADILSRTELNKLQRDYISDMKQSANTLLNIINDILDFSKVEAGMSEIINAPYNLREVIINMQNVYTPMFAVKDIAFDVIYDKETLPKWVTGDEQRIRQCLTNMISNALKYTRIGGVILKIYLKDDNLFFEVSDTGIGIKEEDYGKVFSAFERLDLNVNRTIQGTGLGMPVSYDFCKLMGGELSVRSIYGEGSTFTMRIPYVSAAEIEETKFDESIVQAPGLKALITDDIEINVLITHTMLESMGVDADCAYGGEEAVRLAGEKEGGYDIIFMDHMMPEVDGVEAVKRIRALGGKNAEIPIIALTATVTGDAITFFRQSGFTDLLPKPLELSALNQVMKKYV
ncbi:MAG: response regulator [Ruminococcus sp.]|jgi:signal transduction histidine kinase/CheY-like chemotaxis protein|nr:response regulator [Ruminococcus sp.]